MSLRPWPVTQPRLPLAFVLAAIVGLATVGCGGGAANPTVAPGGTLDTSATEPDETAEPVDATTSPGNPVPTKASATDPVFDLGNGRPSAVTLTLAGTSQEVVGGYSGAGLTRQCGNSKYYTSGNVKAFGYGFPYEDTGEIHDVTIFADDLLDGTTTTAFSVSVSVTAKDGSHPPVIYAAPGDIDGDSGTLQRTDAGGTTTLVAAARNAFGESINVTVTCGPKAG